MKLLFATGNDMKKTLMQERLKELNNIEIVTPKTLGINIDVLEDGLTPEENAMKKAKAYYDATHMPVIAEDSGLYIDKFLECEQPGLFVKRVNGQEGLSDDVILKYYLDKLNNYGGESEACYHTGVCLIDADGNIYTNVIEETKFLLTTKVDTDSVGLSGGVLECISYDLNAQKYFSKRTEEDKKRHYQKLDNEYKKLVKKYILNKGKI